MSKFSSSSIPSTKVNITKSQLEQMCGRVFQMGFSAGKNSPSDEITKGMDFHAYLTGMIDGMEIVNSEISETVAKAAASPKY